jgi:hypothetical protein
MKWKASLGAEPKKVGALVGLIVMAGIVYMFNREPGDSTPHPAATTKASTAVPGKPAMRSISRSSGRITPGGKGPREFRPSIKAKDIDTSSVDPTLHLSQLARLQEVKVEAGKRSLFEISAAPPAEVKVAEPAKIAIAYVPSGPQKPKPIETPKPPPPPNAPPIPLKFYGWVNREKAGPKRAFFMDNDEIVIAGEGDLVKKRYKIIRIGVNSALVEDTQFKSNAQQQLPLEAELQG